MTRKEYLWWFWTGQITVGTAKCMPDNPACDTYSYLNQCPRGARDYAQITEMCQDPDGNLYKQCTPVPCSNQPPAVMAPVFLTPTSEPANASMAGMGAAISYASCLKILFASRTGGAYAGGGTFSLDQFCYLLGNSKNACLVASGLQANWFPYLCASTASVGCKQLAEALATFLAYCARA